MYMGKKYKLKQIIVLALTITILGMIFSSYILAEPADSLIEIEEKLAGISEDEREVLQNLFILIQEIEQMEKQEDRMTQEIQYINQDMQQIEITIAQEEKEFIKKRDILQEVLKSYQKTGPGTYLEIILNSDSLTTFLRRIALLQDLTRNTGDILKGLEISTQKLSIQKRELEQKRLAIEDKKQELKKALDKKMEKREEIEKYLASLKEKQVYYQQQLDNLQKAWDELKVFFADMAKEFSRIIEEDGLPQDDIQMNISFLTIKGSIHEKIFSDTLAKYPQLSDMVLVFEEGRLKVEVPKKKLILYGKFIIIEGHSLKFEIEEGSFYGMTLKSESIKELFREGDMMINFKSLIGNHILQSVEIKEGKMEFVIKLVLF